MSSQNLLVRSGPAIDTYFWFLAVGVILAAHGTRRTAHGKNMKKNKREVVKKKMDGGR
jgi:hypothetical protein